MAEVSNMLQSTERRLADAGIESARTEAHILVSRATGITRAHLIGRSDREATARQIANLDALIGRRLRHEPIAYIVGEREFWSLPFRVDTSTLIPRPDSETLIEAVVEHYGNRMQHLRVLDLGTGSGCLLLALLKEFPWARGLGIDRSVAALRLARQNASTLGMTGGVSGSKATFAAMDWMSGIGARFDLIVANPPYIAAADWADLEPDVRCYEPPSALLAGPDGLDAYRALAPQLPAALAPGGVFAGEFGIGQAEAVCKILAACGLRVLDVHRDLAGTERCFLATAA